MTDVRMPQLQDGPFDKRSRLGTAASAVWLVFLSQPISAAWNADDDVAKWLALAALAAFCVGYVGLFQWVRRSQDEAWTNGPRQWAALLGLGVLAVLSVPGAGQSSTACLVFICAASIVLLRGRRRAAFVIGLLVVSLSLPAIVTSWTFDTGVPFGIVLASFAVFGMTKVIERNRQLGTAYEEIARLAISEERDRIGRDLHDILGHSLTVITVKAELAGRLLRTDVDRTAVEIADIERLAREALSDVRTTIAGNRRVTLAVEIANARSALSGAGIEADLPNAVDEVVGERHELFGWAVREGVTNVVRHSGASTCVVRVDANCLEVLDDGRGPGARCPDGEGSGLRGLRERVHLAGGRLHIDARDSGGFRLHVQLPELLR